MFLTDFYYFVTICGLNRTGDIRHVMVFGQSPMSLMGVGQSTMEKGNLELLYSLPTLEMFPAVF
jgi:hypothetical protein